MPTASRLHLAFVVVAALGCAPRTLRFADAPPIWYVDDDRDIPRPETRDFAHIQYFVDVLGPRQLTRALELRDLEPAHDTNSLDEVPNSTWFTNRIGVRTLTPAEGARGPVVDGPPVLPLLVTGGKHGGRNPGFMAKDATGRTFVVKIDVTAGNDVVVDRMLWAIGYNVPQDTLVSFTREDLRLDPSATIVPRTGKERPMTVADLDATLRASTRAPDGTYGAAASQFLPGKPLGGPPAEGVRLDDPNDTIRHEHRRVLRGLRVFAAWVSHTDMKEDNLLDMYVEADGRHFVRHYLLDFGGALGGHDRRALHVREDGYEFIVDWQKNGLAAVSLGLWERPWERQRPTPWPAIGSFSAAEFDPARWREFAPFWPFHEMDPADAYWAAKIVMRFDRPMLTAIVGEGRFGPEASEYLVDTLLARGRKIGQAFIETLTPLDAFHVEGRRLCAWDLGVVYELGRGGVVEQLGRRRVIAEHTIGRDGKVCLDVPESEAYTVLRLRVRRGERRRPAMQVHVVGGSRPRVLGIVRTEGGPCIKGRGRPRCR
jgi:hypothetical protein